MIDPPAECADPWIILTVLLDVIVQLLQGLGPMAEFWEVVLKLANYCTTGYTP